MGKHRIGTRSWIAIVALAFFAAFFSAAMMATAASPLEAHAATASGAAALGTQASTPKAGAKGYYSKIGKYMGSGAHKVSYKEAGCWYNPNYTVVIKSYKNKKLKFTYGYTGPNANQIYSTGLISAKVSGGKASFKWSDNYLEKGKGIIKLGKGYVKVKAWEPQKKNPPYSRLSTGGRYLKMVKMSKKAYESATNIG